MYFAVKAIPEWDFFKSFRGLKEFVAISFQEYPDVLNNPHATLFQCRSKYDVSNEIEKMFKRIGRYYSSFNAKSTCFREFIDKGDGTLSPVLGLETSEYINEIQERFSLECKSKKVFLKLKDIKPIEEIHITICKKVSEGQISVLLDLVDKKYTWVKNTIVKFERLECVIYDDNWRFIRKFKIELSNNLDPETLNNQLVLL